MANLEKLRNRLEQIKQGNRYPTREGSNSYWKPKQDGTKSTLRLIHYPHSSEDPFIEKWFYYGIGERAGFLAPYMLGKPDPIREFAQTLWQSESPKDRELAKKLSAKQRFYAVVVDREDSSMTPKYWAFGIRIYEKLVNALLDQDTAHYLDPDNGIDIEVWQVKTPGKPYPETEFKFMRKDSALGTKSEIETVMKKVVPAEDLFKPLTTAEVRQKLDSWLSTPGESGSDEDRSTETVRGGSGTDTETATDIDADFDRALQNANIE